MKIAGLEETQAGIKIAGRNISNLKNDRMISVHLQGKPFNITVIQTMPQPVMLKKLKLNGFIKTYMTF